MVRHAGFAVAASLGEAYLNQTLWAAFADLEPISGKQLFTLPATVPIAGGGTARVSGVALFEQRPTMQLRANPGNTIAMTAAAIAYVAANTDIAAPIDVDQTWKLRLTANVDVAADVDVDVAANGVFLRWQAGGSSINNINVTVLEGPGIPRFLVDAINSPQTHAAMTSALHAVGPIRISDRLFPRTLEHVQPVNFRKTNFSVFEWFRIHEDISRIGLRVKDGSISLGIDFAGMTNGDDNALVDLIQQVGDGPVYRWPIFSSPSGSPLLVPSGARQGGDIAVLVNSDMLSAIVAKISSQIAGTPVFPRIKINSVSLRPAFFEKPLRGREIGLMFEFTVNHQDAGDITGRVFLQPFLFTDASNRPNPFQDAWRIYMGKAEIDVPWWVDVAVALTGTALAVAFPIASPLLAVGAIAAIVGIIPAAVDNVEATAEAALGQGSTLALGTHDSTLPTQKHQPAFSGVTKIQVNTDGVGINMINVAPSLRFDTGDATVNVASLTGSLDARSPDPYVFSLALRNDLMSLAAECTVQLIVRRADTGAEVARSEGPYNTNRIVVLSHMNADLYHVDQYLVRARIFLNQVTMTGLLFAADTSFNVTDPLKRHHPFVTWESHWAHFRSPIDPTAFWHRFSSPTMHRTAASARCLALRQRIIRLANNQFGMPMDYIDTLDFEFSDLPAHRGAVCDYCFFGGPNLTEPFPQEDWFIR